MILMHIQQSTFLFFLEIPRSLPTLLNPPAKSVLSAHRIVYQQCDISGVQRASVQGGMLATYKRVVGRHMYRVVHTPGVYREAYIAQYTLLLRVLGG